MKIDEFERIPARPESDFTIATTLPALELDTAKYRAELAPLEMTDAQANELLAILWSIMRSFVELGFEGDVCAALFPPEVRDA